MQPAASNQQPAAQCAVAHSTALAVGIAHRASRLFKILIA
jgi:hypothetical protein